MKKNALLQWKEFGVDNAPSITTLFNEKKYTNQERIAEYLEHGKVSLVATSYERDAISGQLIKPLRSKCIMTDGELSWSRSKRWQDI